MHIYVNNQRCELPENAIRELIANAIIHRQLERNSCVQVFIYDDRLEITSPGTLYNGLTIEMMKTGYFETRNITVANIFKYLGLIESFGTGIKRTIEECNYYGIKEPEFIEKGPMLRVNFYRPSYYKHDANEKANDANEKANDTDGIAEIIIQEIIKNNKVTIKELEKITNKSKSTILRIIKNNKCINRVGSSKSGYWEVIE